MPRISPVLGSADAAVTAILDDIKARRGKVPNAMATLAQSSAAFNGYHAFSKALMRGRLTSRQREIVALVTAQANACQYCLSGHTQTAATVGLQFLRNSQCPGWKERQRTGQCHCDFCREGDSAQRPGRRCRCCDCARGWC